jgi:hypothetical protein
MPGLTLTEGDKGERGGLETGLKPPDLVDLLGCGLDSVGNETPIFADKPDPAPASVMLGC